MCYVLTGTYIYCYLQYGKQPHSQANSSTASEAFSVFIQENLSQIPQHKSESTNLFRKRHVYTQQVCDAISAVSQKLRAKYRAGCRNNRMDIDHWLRFTNKLWREDANSHDNLEAGHLSELQVRGAFLASKFTVRDEANSLTARVLKFPDFLEALVRLAHKQALIHNMVLAGGNTQVIEQVLSGGGGMEMTATSTPTDTTSSSVDLAALVAMTHKLTKLVNNVKHSEVVMALSALLQLLL